MRAQHQKGSKAVKDKNVGGSSDLGSATAAVLLCISLISLLYQKNAATPYMDEPFHVGQTRKYCQGRFHEWDPKITTFPGLYILAAPIGSLVSKIQASLAPNLQVEECSTQVLRSVNVGLAIAVFWLSHKIHRQLHRNVTPNVALLTALVVLLWPTNFFYIFLFYTDMGSLAAVLATFLAALNRKYLVAGIAGSVAVLFRQTNAVWVAFILGDAVLRLLSSNPILKERSSRYGLSQQVVAAVRLSVRNWRLLLSHLWPLVAVPVLFAGFVVQNGGIVVGDRSNHTPTLHLTQPLYFALFAAVALNQLHFVPSRFSEASRLMAGALRSHPKQLVKSWIVVFVFIFYTVRSFTMAHPFLLADNRHYTFYLWKDVIAAYPMAKFCLIPLYMYALWSLRHSLRAGGCLEIWIVGFAIATCLTLIPAWLIEFRYFTVPSVLVLLFVQPPDPAQLIRTIILFCIVNAATIYVFLYRPFTWVDGTVARFMW